MRVNAHLEESTTESESLRMLSSGRQFSNLPFRVANSVSEIFTGRSFVFSFQGPALSDQRKWGGGMLCSSKEQVQPTRLARYACIYLIHPGLTLDKDSGVFGFIGGINCTCFRGTVASWHRFRPGEFPDPTEVFDRNYAWRGRRLRLQQRRPVGHFPGERRPRR